MNKEQYINCNKQIKCVQCNRIIDKNNFSFKDIHIDNTGICKACAWENRNKKKIENISIEKTTLRKILQYIFSEENILLNNLVSQINCSIKDIVQIVSLLKIGNKNYQVGVLCDYCKKEIYITPSKFLNNQNNYCSHECYWKDKELKIAKGKNSVYYDRIKTVCSNCGKEIEIIPYSYKIKNKNGDNHNFCCQQCYWEYRKKYYINKNAYWFNKHRSEKTIDNMRQATIRTLSSKKVDLDTKPQLILNSYLEQMNIKYEREYPTKYYSIDNYLPEYNLMIEVMGDYWHGNPIKFNKNTYGLTKTQLKDIKKDKAKHTYIKRYYNIEILYLWESDIINNIELCKKIIQEYILVNGVLSNYHSFNYNIDNGILRLNSNIIIPYQQQVVSKYNKLLKQKAS